MKSSTVDGAGIEDPELPLVYKGVTRCTNCHILYNGWLCICGNQGSILSLTTVLI